MTAGPSGIGTWMPAGSNDTTAPGATVPVTSAMLVAAGAGVAAGAVHPAVVAIAITSAANSRIIALILQWAAFAS